MIRWLHDHSLSLVLAIFYLLFQSAGTVVGLLMTKKSGWELFQIAMQGHADDVLGAWFIVVFTKWFIEKGSPESKE